MADVASPWVGIAFYVVAALCVGTALAVVLLPRIIHAALFLVLFFVSIAGIYVLLHAEFVAVAQVLIYAGAITVLVLFAIMLTHGIGTERTNPNNAQVGWAALVAAGALAALLPALLGFTGGLAWPAPGENFQRCLTGGAAAPMVSDVAQCLGRLMLTDYALAFEISSVLLLVAMIGAILIARETPEPREATGGANADTHATTSAEADATARREKLPSAPTRPAR